MGVLGKVGMGLVLFFGFQMALSAFVQIKYHFDTPEGRLRCACVVADLVHTGKKVQFAQLEKDYPTMVHFQDEQGRYAQDRYASAEFMVYYCHFLVVFLWVVLAPLQLTASFRNRFIAVHRLCGSILILCSTVLTISGLYMVATSISFSDPISSGLFTFNTSLIVLALVFMGSVSVAYMRIAAKDVEGHKRWMIRHIGYGYSVAMMRIVVLSIALYFDGQKDPRRTDISFKRYWLGFSGWAGVLINVAVVELVTFLITRKTETTSTHSKKAF